MAKQVSFTKYEAVLLLDAYLQIVKKGISRKSAIKKCSEDLRNMAINNGLEIDEVYRNTNGITFQMASMESAYQERTIVKPATCLFNEIVNKYRNDRSEYERLLKEARSMLEINKNNEVLFMDWLSKKVSSAQLSELYMALGEIEQQAKKAKFVQKSLYENIDVKAYKKIRDNIAQNKVFHFTDKRQMSVINVAIDYLIQYAQKKDFLDTRNTEPELEINLVVNQLEMQTKSDYIADTQTKDDRWNTPVTDMSELQKIKGNEDDIKPYITVLIEYFPRGFRLDSSLEMKKFRRYYELVNRTALKTEQEETENIIRKCGIIHDGRVYMPESMMGDEVRDKLFAYINKSFSEGKTAIYFEALFCEFSEEFLDYNMYDADMLKAYIGYVAGDRYYISKNYLSNQRQVSADPMDEIRIFLKERVLPIEVDELCSVLSHIPKDKIKFLLGSNGEFVRNSKGKYFHADAFCVTSEELENISVLINEEIDTHKFISGNELYDVIQRKFPYIYEQNSVFSVIGWRDALKYKLHNRFSFVGNVISRKNAQLSMTDIFAGFAKEHQSFTMEELMNFAKNIGSTIYFDALYRNTVRISKQRFVIKNDVWFQVKETDKILDRFCQDDYLSLPNIKDFGIFPEASHPWTPFLLEQYLASYSIDYYLMHVSYNRNVVVGAMVKRKKNFVDFDDLVTEILAQGDVILQKKPALNYLADNGYIARRSYTNIESLLINARARRNMKEK